jgi:5'-nucleotidase
VRILLTNDDGVFAPGLAAMENELRRMGEVTVVSPSTEQSGVGHSITFLRPLVCKAVFDGDRRRGYAVEGSPADCVKLGVFELCQPKPDLIVSGINSGLNAGIQVLYSGTVAAAIEGAFFGIPSVAVSFEEQEHPDFAAAAALARRVIGQLLPRWPTEAKLFNLNIPRKAVVENHFRVRTVPMGIARYGEHFDRRVDPKGRTYYWATNDPPPQRGKEATDLTVLEEGDISLTPLHFDLTLRNTLAEMSKWDWQSP